MAAAYEAQRRRQMEENKRRIDELGLHHLAAAVMPPQAKLQKPKHKARVPGAAATKPRRSERLAKLPEQRDSRESQRNTKRRVGPTTVERSQAIAKAKAKELEGELGAHYPTFVKTMSPTFIDASRMELGRHFCRESRRGTQGDLLNCLLDDGDCTVFQPVEQTKFKVYIIRAASVSISLGSSSIMFEHYIFI